jgi:hypothetical protein
MAKMGTVVRIQRCARLWRRWGWGVAAVMPSQSSRVEHGTATVTFRFDLGPVTAGRCWTKRGARRAGSTTVALSPSTVRANVDGTPVPPAGGPCA